MKQRQTSGGDDTVATHSPIAGDEGNEEAECTG
jgi:hypothetical protein